ncbi:MAG: type II toxin-antitoxin system RelE/ParE family toxin [Rhodothermales bacterium]
MNTRFRKSFERDLKKLRNDRQTLGRIRSAILVVEEANSLDNVPGLKRLTGGSGDYCRIRVGDYRVGIELVGDVVVFTRCLHRREVYRYFP